MTLSMVYTYHTCLLQCPQYMYIATVLLKAMLQMHAILLRITSAYQAY